MMVPGRGMWLPTMVGFARHSHHSKHRERDPLPRWNLGGSAVCLGGSSVGAPRCHGAEPGGPAGAVLSPDVGGDPKRVKRCLIDNMQCQKVFLM